MNEPSTATTDELELLHVYTDVITNRIGGETPAAGRGVLALLAVARHVLTESGRWRGLLNVSEPDITCFRCGQPLGHWPQASDGPDYQIRHAFSCPSSRVVDALANYDTARDSEAEGQRAANLGGRFGGG